MTVKWITSVFNWPKRAAFLSAMVLVILALSGCAKTAAPQLVVPTAAEMTATQVATSTELPASTATLAPSATPQPSPTTVPTQLPTATLVPPLAVLSDGFSAWCAPESYAGTKPTSPDAPNDARKLVVKDSQMQVQIPASYCEIVYQFNQPVPQGLQVVFFDGNNPFLKLPLVSVNGKPNEAWAAVNHAYVVNPPFWFVTYRIAVTSADGKDLWSNPVKFAKALPPTCIYTNKLPDPVTGWCPVSDPLEIEPHPNQKYPYDRSRLLTPQPNH